MTRSRTNPPVRTRQAMPRDYLAIFLTAASLTLWQPLQAASNGEEPPTTWEEFDRQAMAIAPTFAVLAAEVTDGSCTEIHSLNADLVTPIGSSFKLYILAEIAAQILDDQETGLSWEQPLELQQQFKSIPGGPLLFVPDGSVFTTRYFAEQMMQRSDNTATDHLLFLAGRENVERRMAKAGHHDPALNTPLFATREFAVAKFLWSDEELAHYENADVTERRQLLAAEKRGWPELEAFFDQHGDQKVPVRPDTLEWFANRFDMCNVLASLHVMGQQEAQLPLLEVLTLDDPTGFDREDWTYVGYKGGSEMGVLAGNWLVRRNDGRLFVFTVAFLDPAQDLDMGVIVPLLQAATHILYATP